MLVTLVDESRAKGHCGAAASGTTAGLLRAFVPVHICVHVLLTCEEREVLLMSVMWSCAYLKQMVVRVHSSPLPHWATKKALTAPPTISSRRSGGCCVYRNESRMLVGLDAGRT